MLKNLVKNNWKDIFQHQFKSSRFILSAVHCVTDYRNASKYGQGDADTISTLTFLSHVIDVLDATNNGYAKAAVEKDLDEVLIRCVNGLGQHNINVDAVFQEAQKLKVAAVEKEAKADKALRHAEEKEAEANRILALSSLDQAVAGIDRVSIERATAVAQHEAAVAEHEAAVFEHEAAVAELEVAIALLYSAEDELSKANALTQIQQAKQRETAANAVEAAANLREAAADAHSAAADDYQKILAQHGDTLRGLSVRQRSMRKLPTRQFWMLRNGKPLQKKL